MLTDATARNLSLAQTLEALLDRELEARHQRSIERRFKLSRLQSKPFYRQLPLQPSQVSLTAQTRILRLLDLDFLRNGTSVCLIGNPGVGKTYLAKIVAGAPVRPTSGCCSPPPWTCSTISWPRQSIIP